MKTYTALEVASLLKVDYKTVLRLIKRGYLKALPGMRHKRITEHELNRYLGINRPLLAALNSAAPTPSTRPSSENGLTHGQIVVIPNGEGSGVASRVVKPKGNK